MDNDNLNFSLVNMSSSLMERQTADKIAAFPKNAAANRTDDKSNSKRRR